MSKSRFLNVGMELIRSAFVEHGSAKDELRSWEMMPFVEAIMSQHQSYFMLQVGGVIWS